MKIKIAMGKTIKIKYTLRLNEDKEPVAFEEVFEFKYGLREVLPAIEKNLEGKFVNDSASFSIPMEEAYGPYREDQIETVHLEDMPEDIEVGDIIEITMDNDKAHGWIQEILGEHNYIVNFNPPMAGNNLHYDMTIIEVS